jgi:TetR/AcrR family tetracycline transcriptional repressor
MARVNSVTPPGRPWAREAAGPRRSRADKPELSREAIVRAAIRIIDEEGFAQEFGTGAASLYAYVANKDELMDLIVDQIMAESVLPEQEPAEDVAAWQEQLKELARNGYRTMVAHRDVARAFLGRAPFGPNGLRYVEGMLRLLRAHGMPDHIAAYAGDLLGQFVVATAIEHDLWEQRYPDHASSEGAAELRTELGDYLASLPEDRFPNLTAMARMMVGLDPQRPIPERFELGLDILVRGLTAFLPAGVED